MESTGQLIANQFLIKEKLSENNKCSVYLAQELSFKKLPVFLKIFKNDFIAERKEEFIHFKLECEAVSKINHPSIIKIKGMGDSANFPDSSLYIATEFFEGKPLYQLINGKSLDLGAALPLMIKIAESLQTLHDKKLFIEI